MPVSEEQLKKVMVTDDIIEASGSICREIFPKARQGVWYDQCCMIALAWSAANDGEVAEVTDSEITTLVDSNSAIGYSMDLDTSELIHDFDRWVQIHDIPDEKRPAKPKPFCLYVNEQDRVVSIHPDLAANGDVDPDEEE